MGLGLGLDYRQLDSRVAHRDARLHRERRRARDAECRVAGGQPVQAEVRVEGGDAAVGDAHCDEWRHVDIDDGRQALGTKGGKHDDVRALVGGGK